MDRDLVVPVTRVVGIVPAGIRLRTERVPCAGRAKRRGSGHSTTRWMSSVRRLGSHRGTRRHNEEHEQEGEKEAMMRMRKNAKIAQADGIRISSCVHDSFLSENEKERVAVCGPVMINITTNSDMFLAMFYKKRK